MATESYQRNHIENSKKAIHERETDILQGELDALEAQNAKLSSKARSMALDSSVNNMSREDMGKRYKQQRNESIFGEEDIQTVPSTTETSRNSNPNPAN